MCEIVQILQDHSAYISKAMGATLMEIERNRINPKPAGAWMYQILIHSIYYKLCNKYYRKIIVISEKILIYYCFFSK